MRASLPTALEQTLPNKAVERTGKKLALFPRRSPLALGSRPHVGMTGEFGVLKLRAIIAALEIIVSFLVVISVFCAVFARLKNRKR